MQPILIIGCRDENINKTVIQLIDTHSHLFVKEFDADRSDAVERSIEAGVTRICLPCINADSIEPINAMCRDYNGVCYPMIGLHPTDIEDDYREQLSIMQKSLTCDQRYIAVGEVGLDFYWDDSRKKEQIEVFETQIMWAKENKLPLVIHSRNAFDELYAIMYAHRDDNLTGVFHCFSGSIEEAQALLGFQGFMLGIGGTVSYKKSTLPQVLLQAVPLERIVLETDAPYLSPVPYRGRRNESAYVVEVAKFLAQLYNVSYEEVARVTTENAMRVFSKIG